MRSRVAAEYVEWALGAVAGGCFRCVFGFVAGELVRLLVFFFLLWHFPLQYVVERHFDPKSSSTLPAGVTAAAWLFHLYWQVC